jgi:hypothetical protein
MAQAIVPNQFALQAQGIRVNYSTSSITGTARLSFKKGRKTLNFAGRDIRAVDTLIGSLVTVTIANVPDKSVTTFSLLLPAINLAKASSKQSFRTIGITTTNKTSIAGPVKGVQQTYKSVELRGTAQQVQFIAKDKAAGA